MNFSLWNRKQYANKQINSNKNTCTWNDEYDHTFFRLSLYFFLFYILPSLGFPLFTQLFLADFRFNYFPFILLFVCLFCLSTLYFLHAHTARKYINGQGLLMIFKTTENRIRTPQSRIISTAEFIFRVLWQNYMVKVCGLWYGLQKARYLINLKLLGRFFEYVMDYRKIHPIFEIIMHVYKNM